MDVTTKETEQTRRRIWKISHGKPGETFMSNPDHEWLMQEGFVAQGYAHNDTKGKKQGQKFCSIRKGDYLYLVRATEIIFFGCFTSNEYENVPDCCTSITDWLMRPVKVIKLPVRDFFSTEVEGKEGWKPQGYTSVHEVPPQDFAEFETKILKPAFDIDLSQLGISSAPEANFESPTTPSKMSNKRALNQIMYGPPGTGKTYHTVREALKIIENTGEPAGEYSDWKKRFDLLRDTGRIEFITFHQSFSYEDFVEGMRADTKDGQLVYQYKDGVFRRIVTAALYSKLARTRHVTPVFADYYAAFCLQIKNHLPAGFPLISVTGKSLFVASVSAKDNLWVAHAGSVVMHSVGKAALKKLYEAYPSTSKLQARGSMVTAIADVIGSANGTAYYAVLTAFLKFIEENADEMREVISDDEIEPDYPYKRERVKRAEPSDFGPGLPHVLIIDEINRGNMSRIFGELITLIEPTKRLGGKETTRVTLPYSQEPFVVPDNLYLIGTMNTADRSLSLVDTALRRRFDFIEMAPALSELEGLFVSGVDIQLLLKRINERITHLYDREHTIGHAFFMGLWEEGPAALTDLKVIFENKILPLLEEYFFEDWEKIVKVLGNSPIYTKINGGGLGFSSNAKLYQRNPACLGDAATYKAIYLATAGGDNALLEDEDA